jgi:predicted DNA-binding transcriptional regulator YafY
MECEMTHLRRLFAIDAHIRAGKAPSPDALAEEFGVQRRQIFNDIAQLKEEWGAPIKNDRRRGGYIYTESTWVLPTTLLREGELLAFFLTVEMGRSSNNRGLDAPLQSAIAKISDSLGDLVTINLNSLRAAMRFSLPPAALADAAHATGLALAKAHRRKVRLTYYTASRGETTRRTVHPYQLLMDQGEVILLAYDENRGMVLNFNAARIRHLEFQDDHFLTDPSFDLEAYLQTMLRAEAGTQLYQIALKFDEYQSRYIRERIYHPLEQKVDQEDGGLILSFPASGLAEVCRFCLGFGQHCEVLEPKELRQLVTKHVAKLNQVYGEGQ